MDLADILFELQEQEDYLTYYKINDPRRLERELYIKNLLTDYYSKTEDIDDQIST